MVDQENHDDVRAAAIPSDVRAVEAGRGDLSVVLRRDLFWQ